MARALLALVGCTVVMGTGGCGRSGDDGKPVARNDALTVEIVDLDAATAPRGSRPFIAGEPLRLALRVAGGRPPFEVKVITSAGDPRLTSGKTTVGAAGDATPMELAIELPLAAEVQSGTYGLAVHVSDATAFAQARSQPFEVLGSDAERLPEPTGEAWVEIVDVAGRRRRQFLAGESVEIRARLSGESRVAVGIVASDDRELMAAAGYPVDSGALRLPMTIPRLARPGLYSVAVTGASVRTTAPLVVAGKPFAPASKLGIDALTLYGGQDLRTPRLGILRRKEALRVEARIAGGKEAVELIVRLRDQRGQIVAEDPLAKVAIADPHPTARTFAVGDWHLPPDLRPGRHMLEVELSEQDDVATLYREVLFE